MYGSKTGAYPYEPLTSPQHMYYNEARRMPEPTGYVEPTSVGYDAAGDLSKRGGGPTPYVSMTLEDIKGRAGSMAKDQNGSRKIQNLFD